MINEYENKDFIEEKSFEELSHHLKQFENELFCLNKMIESHENSLQINSLINKKGLIYVKNGFSQNSEQNEENKTSVINQLNESISEEKKSLRRNKSEEKVKNKQNIRNIRFGNKNQN